MIQNTIITMGGGMKPELTVTAPNGSTVTANGLSPTSTIIGTTTTDYIFKNLSLGQYTVVATKGTQSKTEYITVAEVKQYNLEIVYALYLYNLGDECTDVTGGWQSWKASPYVTSTLTKNNDNMSHYAYRNSDSYSTSGGIVPDVWNFGALATTMIKVDVTNYNTLHWVGNLSAWYSQEYPKVILTTSLSDTLGVIDNDYIYLLPRLSGLGEYNISIDMSNITGEYYVCIMERVRYRYHTVTNIIKKLWLE